jgi:protein-tyrosine-phosphatase
VDAIAALRSAKRILIVCHGNIIRSAFAARVVAQALGDGSRVLIASGGLAAVPGRPPHPKAVLTANARRVDLSQHTAARVGPGDVAGADVIFVMDLAQLDVMRTRFPEARDKTFLLTCLAPGTPLEVRDPVDGGESRFRVCFDHITRAVGPIVRVLSEAAR